LRTELDLIGLPVADIEKTGKLEEELHLHAPVTGYITKINANLGKLVTPNDLLYEVVDNLHLHLELQVFAKDIELLAPGQRIIAEAPGTGKTFEAEVHLVGKMIDPETKTTMVHGHFLKEPVSLIPGTAVQSRIMTNAADALTLPVDAIVKEGGRAFVFIEKPGGFEKTLINIGLSDNDWVEVIGLDPNSTVAISGAYYLNGSVSKEE
jgi:cobalt-zinc-cadmium efflux system membrane fusion protein